MDKATKIEEADLWKMRALNAQLTLEKERAERALVAYQEHLDSIWTKYELRKDKDQIDPNGTILRAGEEAKQ